MNLDAITHSLSNVKMTSITTLVNATASTQARGLYHFIAEIRDAKSKDEERKRVDKELGNVRQKFANSATLSSYQKKKYVAKLCYIYMLGYEVDFGHLEFISLMSSTKFTEKAIGYMAVQLFLKTGDEMMTLVINSMRNDIVSPIHFGKTLALSTVSNIGGLDLAEALASDVQKLVVSPADQPRQYMPGPPGADMPETNHPALICKKATLCLLRLFRTNPDCLDVEQWVPRIGRLLEDRDMGVITSGLSLLMGMAIESPEMVAALIPYVISILQRMNVSRSCPPDYMYYRTPSPWIQVKCLRFLQFYEVPDRQQKELLFDALTQIMSTTEASDSVNKSNADHSILFEAINLVIHYGEDCTDGLRNTCVSILGRFIATDEANIRYLGLDVMNTMVKRQGAELAKQYQSIVIDCFKVTDVSVRKRALELLYSLTDADNCHEIVEEILNNLASADSLLKEDMVVKMAILAERYPGDSLEWYFNTMLKTILIAGDYVAEAVWYRIVMIVTNHPDLHEFAAERLLETVQSKWSHDTAVALAAYVLGEVGVSVCDKPGMSGFDQFVALHQHYPLCSIKTQAILLTSYMKFLNLYPDTKEAIMDVFSKYSTSAQLELQQRACEYMQMPNIGAETMEQVLNAMPPYPEDKENVLEKLNEGARAAAMSEELEGYGNKRQTFDDRSVGEYSAGSGSADPPSNGFNSAPAQQQAVDLLALDDDTDAPSYASDTAGGFVYLTAEETAQVEAASLKALLAPAGQKSVLLDNSTITVSCMTDYRQHQGRLMFTFYNKSMYEFSSVSVEAGSVDGLGVKQQGPAVIVTAGDEGKVQLALASEKPFTDAPKLTLSFSAGGGMYRYSFPVPVTIASFFDPIPMDKATYMQRWKMLENEIQEVFGSSKAVTTDLCGAIKTSMFPGLKIGHCAELDTERTATGCCSFRTGTTGPDGKLISVGAMLRLEADFAQSRFRITIRSKHPMVSQGIFKLIKDQLA